MPRRSKVELSQDTVHELENQFFSFLDSLNHEETRKFYQEFLTNEEKMMMYKRLALYWALFEGYSLASIQRMLGVTHDTTRLYNKRKNEMSQEFKDIVSRIGRSTEAAEHEVPSAYVPAEKVEEKVEEVAPVMMNHQEEEMPVIEEQVEEIEEEKMEEKAEEPMQQEMHEPTEEVNEEVKEEVETHEEIRTEGANENQNEEIKTSEDHVQQSSQEENQNPELDQMRAQNEADRREADSDDEENKDEDKKGWFKRFGF